MAPSHSASAESPETVFAIDARAMYAARLPAVLLAGFSLYVVFLAFRIDFSDEPENLVVFFWIAWFGLVVLTLSRALVIWRKVPPAVRGGTLRIGPGGIDYRVGAEHRRLEWREVAAVHPIPRPNGGSVPAALWLTFEETGRLASSREGSLQRAMRKTPHRPVDRPDGLLLPIALFGGAKTTTRIVETAELFRAASGRDGRAA